MAFSFIFPFVTGYTGGGTVTSVGLNMPSTFNVTDSPVTGSGTISVTWASETANKVFASPDGTNGTPTFRSLAANDLPTATISDKGALSIATNAEALAGSAVKSIVPSSLIYTFNNWQIGTITTSNTAITSTDTINSAFAKTQGQLDAKQNTLTLGNVTGSEFSITGGTGAVVGSGLTLALATTAVSAGTYGSNTSVPVFTVDSKGRITGVTNTAISFPPSGVTSVFSRTGAVVAQTNDYTFAQIGSTPTTVSGYGNLRYQSAAPSGLSNYGTLYSNATGNLGYIKNGNAFGNTIVFNGTTSRTYTLPDVDGTFAFTTDLASYVTVGTTQTITGAKTFSAETIIGGNIIFSSTINNSLTGVNARVPSHTTSVIKFTNASLTSIASANNGGVVDGHVFTISNNTGNTITIINNYGSAAAGEAIYTGTGGDVYLLNNSELSLQYNSTSNAWITVSGGLFFNNLSNNYIPKWNGTNLIDSYISENTSAVYTKPYPTTTSTPTGTGSFSGGLKWLDNGGTIAGLYIYKPYTNGNSAGWYPILDAQNPTFPALSISTSAIGIQLAAMSNSYSTPPTNTHNPEIKFIRVGNNRGIGMWQGGSGYQFLNPYNGKDWVCIIGINGYLRDWDGQIIASTANGGKGNGSSSLVDVLKSWNTKIRFRAMANTNSPYYYLSGVVSVNSSGNCTNLVITQPSSNTAAFNAVINNGKLQFASTGGWDGCTVFCEKLTDRYGDQYALGETNQTYSADGQTQNWIGSGGMKLDGGLQIQLTGTNKRIVDATLVNGVVTVSNTSVSANTRFFPTYQTVIGTSGILVKTAQVNSTSFTITSQVAGATNTADNSVITIILIETY
jgi:hypothetical protein